jgi:molybdopterin-guanine dinucleotide biosynthesis protein A
MTNPDSICFGLLAGGKSARMGKDKAFLIWRGQPLWQHQLRLAAEIGAREVLISGKADGSYRGAARAVPDEIPDAGPLAGIAALLGAMKSDWLVIVGVDMPFVEARDLKVLLGARAENCGVVPSLNGRVEPLAAVYPQSLALLAQQQVAYTDRSLQAFAWAAQAAGLVSLFEWPGGKARALSSVNSPEEWANALKA